MPKVTVDVVVKHIEAAVRDHVADINHRLAHNVHGFSHDQIVAAMGDKAAHLTNYLGTGALVVSTPVKSVASASQVAPAKPAPAKPAPAKTAPAATAPVESASGSQHSSGSGQ